MPKKILSKDFFTYEEILHAYMQCRKYKRNTKACVDFEKNFMDKLEVLLRQINSREYTPGRYTCFAVMHPKPREVWAAPFKERIVHHLIYNELVEEFEKHFIDQTYSCIKRRGTIKAIYDAHKGMRRLSHNFEKDIYYIKLDIRNYFVSINKNILWNLLKEQIDENSLLGWLVKNSIYSDFTNNPKLKNEDKLYAIPEYKSLYRNASETHGLPIGNLTSQFYSNIYLDGLDQYCKHCLKLKCYYRYADDILILIDNKHNIRKTITNINEWLIKNRELCLNPKKIIVNKCRYGVKFLGSRIYPYYIAPASSMVYKCSKLVKKFNKHPFNRKLFMSINSYLGLCGSFDTYNARKKLLNKCQLSLIYNNDVGKIFYLK